MSTLESTPPGPPPIPASALPNGGSRELADDVFQSAEEAVLVQALPDVMGAASRDAQPTVNRGRSSSVMQAVRSQVAARPCEAALLAASAGALAMWTLRRRLRERLGSH
jgi:hypothetical protein